MELIHETTDPFDDSHNKEGTIKQTEILSRKFLIEATMGEDIPTLKYFLETDPQKSLGIISRTAIFYGCYNVIKLLMDYGFDFNAVNNILLYILSSSNYELIKLFLENHPDLKKQSNAVPYCIKYCPLEIIVLLLEYGFNFDEELILGSVVKRNSVEITKFILANHLCRPIQIFRKMFSHYHSLIEFEMFKLLIDYGLTISDINTICNFMTNKCYFDFPFNINQNDDIMKFLIDGGLDLKCVGNNIVCRYIYCGNITMLKYLIDFGYNIFEQLDILLMAIETNASDHIINFILESGYIEKNQKKILIEVCERNNLSALKILIEHEFDIESHVIDLIETVTQSTNGNFSIYKFLIETYTNKQIDPYTELVVAVENDDVDTIKQLLDAQYDNTHIHIDLTKYNYYIFMLIISKNSIKIFEIFLNHDNNSNLNKSDLFKNLFTNLFGNSYYLNLNHGYVVQGDLTKNVEFIKIIMDGYIEYYDEINVELICKKFYNAVNENNVEMIKLLSNYNIKLDYNRIINYVNSDINIEIVQICFQICLPNKEQIKKMINIAITNNRKDLVKFLLTYYNQL